MSATRRTVVLLAATIATLCVGSGVAVLAQASPRPIAAEHKRDGGPPRDGQTIFRYETFGDEQLWTDSLRLHEVIEAALDPLTALQLGLKVDMDALPEGLISALSAGEVDLADPATTLALIELDAVVGIVGSVDRSGATPHLTRVGITCALCHSTVDDALAPGIGHRLDGWPNRDLDAGAIIALSPAIPEQARAAYNSWGPGKYDPRFNIDGLSTPLVVPPAYGLSDVSRATYTGEGSVSYWNKYVAVTQMGGEGSFTDPRLGIHIVHTPDLVQRKLGALRAYQFSLETPDPQAGTFDPVAAERGRSVFMGDGRCGGCHLPPTYTDINLGVLHAPEETGMDGAYAARTTTGRYRTTPLRGLSLHAPYFHDGSAPTLPAVVDHYDRHFGLGLREDEKRDLVEFLKSL